jgi:hypothetical protein
MVWLLVVVQLAAAWIVVALRVNPGPSTDQVVARGRLVVSRLALAACPGGVHVVAGTVPGSGKAMAGPCRVVIAATWRPSSWKAATDVLLHEAAHVRVGVTHLHDAVWRRDYERLLAAAG